MKQLKHYVFAGILCCGFIFGLSSYALACKAMGTNKHVGVIQSINQDAKTFSIIDAETGKRMDFDASSEIIEKIKVELRVIVTFRMKGEVLIAEAVES